MLPSKSTLRSWLLLVFCLAVAVTTRAQSVTATLSGAVTNEIGGAVPGANVTVTNTGTRFQRQVTTNGEGFFTIPLLPPGSYDVQVIRDGFVPVEIRNVALNFNDQRALNIRLKVGHVSELVEVKADVTPVQTASGERSALLDDKQIATLLDPARNFLNLTRVLPGVVATSTVGQDQLGIYGIDTVNGVRSEYSTVSIDGVNANTNARGIDRVETPLNTDAIAEVKILQNNYQAEFGGASGSLINAVTKGGAQRFHGAVYYYKRHEEFNANDFFDNQAGLPKPLNRFNTIGYNGGGPVLLPHVDLNRKRDKLFFFFSQEIWPTVHPGDGTPLKLTVPTALERQGDFSQSANPLADPQKIATGVTCKKINDPGCFPGNVIPANRINTDMQRLLNLLPQANFFNRAVSGGKYNFLLPLTEKNPVNQKVLRLDYNISDKWRAYFRGVDMTVKSQGNAAAFAPMVYLPNFPVDYVNHSPNVAVNLTYVISPTLVNELNLGWASWSEEQVLASGQTELAAARKSALGITLGQFRPQLNPSGLIPALTLGGGGLSNLPSIGFSGTNGGRFPIHSQSRSYGLSDGLTKEWSGHTSKAGIYFHIDRYVQLHTAGNFAGLYNFSVNNQNPLDSGNTFANALLGNFQTYSESTGAPDSDPITRILDWYVQDSWKIRKRFTLDYGLRFSWDLPQTLHTGANFVPELYDPTQRPVLYQPALVGKTKVGVDPRNGNQVSALLIGAVVPGSGNPFDGLATINDSNVVQSQGLLVAPRIGFSWDVFGDGKTAIRGGGGVFYNSRPPSADAGALATNPPIQANPTYPFGNISQLFNAPDNSLIFPSNLAGASLRRQADRPVFYNSSLGIQRSLGFDTVLDIAYVGTLGRHLGQRLDLNALPPGIRFLKASQDPTTGKPLADNFLRHYLGLGSIPFTEFSGTSNYNSLQVSLTRRFTRALSFGANYTWSKALDYSDSTGSGVANFAPRRAYNYGLAGFDRDHAVKINWLWSIPRASSLWDNKIIRAGFDNWQLSGIASFIRGAPMGINLNTGGIDLTGGGDAARALLIGSPVLDHGGRTIARYFNTDVVREPAVNTVGSNGQYSNFVGNAGKVVFRGPGANNWDVALFKNISIKERVTVQLRGEFYNLFNHPSFNSVDNTAVFDSTGKQTNGTFGQLNGDLGPRQIQLTARISF